MDQQKVAVDGLVIKAQSGFFTVQTAHGLVVAKVRGALLKERLDTDPVAIGDRVTLQITRKGAVIEAVEPRARAFTRQKVSPAGRTGLPIDREQVIIANPDQVVFVFACAQPAPQPRGLDRFLVIAERSDIPAIIVANKVDLTGMEEAQAIFGPYERIGYPVIYASALRGQGVDALREALTGRISALTGPSGVGKSSLLNTVQPGLWLASKTVSEANEKGRHTTVASELFPLEGGGYVADTPGIRAVGLFDIEPSELDAYFAEFRPHLAACRFNNCRHEAEPGCGVREALEAGEIDPARYDSYLRLLEEVDELYYRC